MLIYFRLQVLKCRWNSYIYCRNCLKSFHKNSTKARSWCSFLAILRNACVSNSEIWFSSNCIYVYVARKQKDLKTVICNILLPKLHQDQFCGPVKLSCGLIWWWPKLILRYQPPPWPPWAFDQICYFSSGSWKPNIGDILKLYSKWVSIFGFNHAPHILNKLLRSVLC